MKLINPDKLREEMYHNAFETDTELQKWDGGCWIRYKLFENILDAQPIVDARERKKGKWIEDGYWSEGVGMGEVYGNYFKCSICSARVRDGYKHCCMNYCPYCGSDNREGTNDAT